MEQTLKITDFTERRSHKRQSLDIWSRYLKQEDMYEGNISKTTLQNVMNENVDENNQHVDVSPLTRLAQLVDTLNEEWEVVG